MPTLIIETDNYQVFADLLDVEMSKNVKRLVITAATDTETHVLLDIMLDPVARANLKLVL